MMRAMTKKAPRGPPNQDQRGAPAMGGRVGWGLGWVGLGWVGSGWVGLGWVDASTHMEGRMVVGLQGGEGRADEGGLGARAVEEEVD